MGRWADNLINSIEKKLKVKADAQYSPADQQGIDQDRMSQKPEMIRSGMECTGCGYKVADMGNMPKVSEEINTQRPAVASNCPKCGSAMVKFGDSGNGMQDAQQFPKVSPDANQNMGNVTDDNSNLKKYMSDGSQIQAQTFKWSRAASQD